MRMKKQFIICLFHAKKALIFGEMSKYGSNKSQVEIILSPIRVILGNSQLEMPNYVVSIISITAKYYIFQCSQKHINLSISGLQRFFRQYVH